MSGRYPKPDAERRGRQQNLEWTALPVESGMTAPPLPDFRVWQQSTVSWWADLWAKGQAVMWDPTGETLWTLAALMDDMFAARVEPHRVSGEIRQHEDRHGLNPKSMLQLRWRVAEDMEGSEVPVRQRRDRKSSVLKVLEGGG